MKYLFSTLPIPVITDWSEGAQTTIGAEIREGHDIVVFDFPHAAILAPESIPIPSVIFTHNVEAEIPLRHSNVVSDPIRRYIWNNQYKKMLAYERRVLSRFDAIVAVSERDKEAFLKEYGVDNVHVIRTGVDLDYFDYAPPGKENNIVFTGSMDWMANIDGIEYFLDEIWPLISKTEPGSHMTVVGRNPPNHLIARARGMNWEFTGFVDDVRPYMKKSGIYVIPLRVGGGTRLKVFEAMASGCPVVSTAIGVEGLPLTKGQHYVPADSPEEMADAIMKLMSDGDLRNRISRNAREYVEEKCSFRVAAEEFEEICSNTLEQARTR
jgi:glycosyltransferase involved in cell wall biosynthesis